MNNSVEVIDVPMSQLMLNMGEEPLPGDHPAANVTIRQAWSLRAIVAPGDASKISILMEVFQGLTLEGLHDLRSRYESGDLNPQEQQKIAVMKAAMQ